MGRRQIPELGMSPPGGDRIPADGVVVRPYEESMRREPARLSPHYHGFFQTSLLHGPGRLMHDFRETDVRGATLFFVSPGQVHTVRPGPAMHGTIVSFTREFFDGGSADAARLLLEFPFYFTGDAPAWLSLAEQSQASASIVDLFARMQREQDRAEAGYVDVLRALLHILLVQAARIHGTDTTARAGRAAAIVREFHLLVEKHFLEETTLAAYARRLGVGANHLNDVVRETTGQAVGEHIRRRRLLSAKRQLLHSELSVSEIGYRLGFKDASYFSRFFRRYENVAPAEFRLSAREKYQQQPA